jgi:hypothetical protein
VATVPLILQAEVINSSRLFHKFFKKNFYFKNPPFFPNLPKIDFPSSDPFSESNVTEVQDVLLFLDKNFKKINFPSRAM